MSNSIKDFLKAQSYTRKFRPQLKKKYTLVFGDAAPAAGTEKPSMQVGLRNKATGDTCVWITSSKSALDRIADLEKGDVFYLTKKTKVINGTPMQVYDIELADQKEEINDQETGPTDPADAGDTE